MMKTNSQKRILPLALSGGILICLICIYSGRSVLLRSIVNRHTSRIEQTHGLCIHYDKLEMNGLNEIYLQGLSVIPEQRDTLFTLASTRIKLNFWKLLTKKIEVSYIAAEDIRLTFTKQDSIANYDFLFKKDRKVPSQTSGQTVTEINYAEKINKLLNLCYGFLPENGQLKQIYITERKDSNFVSMVFPSFIIKENKFRSTIEIHEDTLTRHWIADGELKQSANTLMAKLYSADSTKVSIPYITRRFGAKVTFDTLSYSMTKESNGKKPAISQRKSESKRT